MSSDKLQRKCSELLEIYGYLISQKQGPLGAEEWFCLGPNVINDLEPGFRFKLRGMSLEGASWSDGVTYVVTEIQGQVVWAVDWGRKFVETCMQETTITEGLYDNRNDY